MVSGCPFNGTVAGHPRDPNEILEGATHAHLMSNSYQSSHQNHSPEAKPSSFSYPVKFWFAGTNVQLTQKFSACEELEIDPKATFDPPYNATLHPFPMSVLPSPKDQRNLLAFKGRIIHERAL